MMKKQTVGVARIALVLTFSLALCAPWPAFSAGKIAMPGIDTAFSGAFIPGGDGILVFPGKTLADLEGCLFWGRMAGKAVTWSGPALSNEPVAFPAGATGASIERYDFDLLKYGAPNIKGVHMQLYNGEGGVWAKSAKAWYKNTGNDMSAANTRCFSVNADGSLTWTGVEDMTVSTNYGGDGYGICELGVAAPVKTASSTLAFPGTTVAKLAKNYSFKIKARMCGCDMGEYWGSGAVVTNMAVLAGSAEAPTSIRIEAQSLCGANGGDLLCAVFTLTDGEGGVYARQTGSYRKTYDASTTTYGTLFAGADGSPAEGAEAFDGATVGLLSPGAGVFNLEATEKASLKAADVFWDRDRYLSSSDTTLVFPGARLEDLEGLCFYGTMDGNYIGKGKYAGVVNAATHQIVRYPSDTAQSIQKLFAGLDALDGEYTKAVIIELSQGADGVHAKAVKDAYRKENFLDENIFTVNTAGAVSFNSGWTIKNVVVSTGDNNGFYGVRRLGAAKVVGGTASPAFPGKTVAGIFRGEIKAHTCGRYIQNKRPLLDYAVCNRVITSVDSETGTITGFRCEAHILDGNTEKCLGLEFTDGEGGVCARAFLPGYVNMNDDAGMPYYGHGTLGRKYIADNGTARSTGWKTDIGLAESSIWAKGYGVCDLEVLLPDDAETGPAVATWNGGDISLASSWSCKAGDGTALSGVLPDENTYVLIPAGKTTMTADADLRPYASVMTAASGLTVDVAGHKLFVRTLEPWLACTITDSAGGGELHIDLAEGMQSYNQQIALSGKLKLVKEGKGCFVPCKKNQTWTGGTVVAAGVLKYGVTGDFVRYWGMGGNNTTTEAAQKIRVDGGAVLDNNGNYWQGYVTYTMNGGTIYGAVGTATDGRGMNSRMDFQTDSYLQTTGDMRWNGTHNLNGKTLFATVKPDTCFYLDKPLSGSGTLNLASGGWMSVKNQDLDMRNVDLIANAALSISKTLSVRDYCAKYVYNYNELSGALRVYGTFTPEGEYFTGATIMDGATIDLSKRTLPWSAQSSFTSGNQLKIADGAHVTLILPETVFPSGTKEIVAVTNLNENLDIDVSRMTCGFANVKTPDGRVIANLRLKSCGSGIAICKTAGFAIIVR